MINVKFINATSVQLLDQNDNTVSNVGEFVSPTEFLLNANTFSQDVEHYYHFAITGSEVQISGVIDSVTTKHQFKNLFAGCSAITVASALQLTASEISEGCYANMFLDCTNLTTPPSTLPATEIAMWCYSSMFGNCPSLTAAPTLPATTLAKYCYYCMFYGCTSLTAAPYLPAETLTDWCYNSMFYNCKNLAKISCDFSEWNGNATSSWTNNVADFGMFTNSKGIDLVFSKSNIPTNWTVYQQPLTFKAINGAASLSLDKTSDSILFVPPSLRYKKGNQNWTDYTYGDLINLNQNQTVEFSGGPSIGHFGFNYSTYCNFKMTGYIESTGNIQSLVNYDNLIYPYQYFRMFQNCTGLVKAPSLPATELKTYCYDGMFGGCTSLTATPKLQATNLEYGCYNYMFYNCTSLTSTTDLPATTIFAASYQGMFEGCTALSTGPSISALSVPASGMQKMFSGCASLSSVRIAFTTWVSDSYNTTNWLAGVADLGTFYCPEELDTSAENNNRRASRCPVNWTVIHLT